MFQSITVFLQMMKYTEVFFWLFRTCFLKSLWVFAIKKVVWFIIFYRVKPEFFSLKKYTYANFLLACIHLVKELCLIPWSINQPVQIHTGCVLSWFWHSSKPPRKICSLLSCVYYQLAKTQPMLFLPLAGLWLFLFY